MATRVTGLLIGIALALVSAGVAHADAPLPVTYGAGPLLAGSFHPDQVAGANDFSCKPSAAHPRPVVLVHGLSATLGDNWATMAPLLKNNGFCVFGLTYGRHPGFDYVGGLTRMEDSSKELAAFVDKVLAATGASQVDLLGHSEGTVMPRWYLGPLGGAPKVKRYVQLTPLWDGTNLAATGDLSRLYRTFAPQFEDVVNAAFSAGGCASCPEFVRGSKYLNTVNAAPGPAIASIDYTEIATKDDELVIPYSSGLLDAPNVRNYVLQDLCPQDRSEHLAVAYDPNAAQLVLNALAPEQARKVTCAATTPLGSSSAPDVGLAPAPASASAPAVATPTRCGVTFALRPRRGERIRRAVASVDGRSTTRRGRALRSLRVASVRAGRRTVRLRLTTSRGTRTTTVHRTVRCSSRSLN